MDITVNVDDYLLNVRTSGVLIHNNKILLHKNINEEHYALLGGRVAIGENSEEKDKNILETMPNKEGKEYLRYEWVDIDEFDRYDLRPKAMKKVLKEKQYTPYIINDDF